MPWMPCHANANANRMPEGMPERMLDKMSDTMPVYMPDRMSEDMPEDMPNRMSEDIPEDMPDRMPEDMLDKIPEYMSDRMPEDLPVTKRISIMEGITRSKVINIQINLSSKFISAVKLGRSFVGKHVQEVHQRDVVILHVRSSHGGARGLDEVLCWPCQLGGSFDSRSNMFAPRAPRWGGGSWRSRSRLSPFPTLPPSPMLAARLPLRFSQTNPQWFIYPQMIYLSPI